MSIADTARFLQSLRTQHERVDALPPGLMPPDLASAYRAQALLVEGLCAHWGGEPAGYKIALTNPAAQRMLGVPYPVFGRLFTARLHESGVTLRAADYVIRLIEVEIAFRMAADVPAVDGGHDRRSVAEFVGALYPAIELVEHHFAGLDRFTPESFAADIAIHGAWIHGTPVDDWRHLDLAAQPTRLLVNGEERLTGSGGNVLGHPLAVVAWLANELPQYGLRLSRGDFVTTGVTTEVIYPAEAGERLVADFPGIGGVELGFE
jgi:2-keto-4-pentenoate hydratase